MGFDDSSVFSDGRSVYEEQGDDLRIIAVGHPCHPVLRVQLCYQGKFKVAYDERQRGASQSPSGQGYSCT